MTDPARLPSSIGMVQHLALVAMLSGCSGLVPARGSRLPPIVDTAIAAGGAALIVHGSHDADGARQVMVIGTAALIAFGISALHGFERAGQPTPPQRGDDDR